MVDRLKAIAAHQGKSIAQLAIAWVLDNPAVTVALVGIRRTEELKKTSITPRRRATDCGTVPAGPLTGIRTG